MEDREHIKDEQRSGRPSTSKTDVNFEHLNTLVRTDCRLKLKILSEQLNLKRFTVHQILTEYLRMRKVCAKIVPKNLTVDQKDIWKQNKCLDLDRIANEQDFFSRVFTGDKSWIFEYDPENKRQSEKWHTANSPRPKRARMIKSMLICFFWHKGNRPQIICSSRTNSDPSFLQRCS